MSTKTELTYGQRLRTAREAAGLSARQVEVKLLIRFGEDVFGAIPAKLSRLENDTQPEARFEDIPLLICLAEIYGCSLSYLSPLAAKRRRAMAPLFCAVSDTRAKRQNLKKMNLDRTRPGNPRPARLAA